MNLPVIKCSYVLYKYIGTEGPNLTIKPEMSRNLFVRLLLRRLRTDGHQTWQGGRGRARKKPRGARFHGNHPVAMATKKR